jgi:hypothetical protein
LAYAECKTAFPSFNQLIFDRVVGTSSAASI